MSLRLRRIEVDGFRKFRAPVVIEGLTDGLKIVIEPNEIGKSTLLEALRAALFVRHGTKNQLMQVILPTCRERAFRHVPGHRLSLTAVA